jgi:SAM-dependent methyltransferase
MPYRKILALLRAAGLASVTDYLRFSLAFVWNFPANQRFKKAFPGLRLPPAYMLYESFRMDYRRYWESGRETAGWIKSQTTPFLSPGQALKILDWGCGPARVLRHLPEIFGSENSFYGTDYNPSTVKWCAQALEGIDISDCPFLPPTQYEEYAFDLVYGISVFTHLPENAHYQWREELFRITKPGAILLLTTQGQAFLEKMTQEEQRLFMDNTLLVRGKTREGHRTFSAFHPEVWARAFFAARFEILRHIPGKKELWGIAQDTWILRRC